MQLKLGLTRMRKRKCIFSKLSMLHKRHFWVRKRRKSSDMYIPTPDASRIWPEAHKYYKDQKFKQPETYIKFSATVEDTVGVEYNMDEVDEKFYRETLCKYYPKKKNKSDENNRKCTELEFETICDKLEKTIEARQPFCLWTPATFYRTRSCRRTLWISLKVQ